MAKFHVNDKGEPGSCKAVVGKCPFGGAAQHYPTKEIAQQAFELSMAAQSFGKNKKYTRPTLSAEESIERNKLFVSHINKQLARPLSAAAKAAILTAVQDAYSKVNSNEDSFVTSEKLVDELEKNLDKSPDLSNAINEDEYYSVQSAAFTFVSPHVGKASSDFEQTLAGDGWDTRGGADSGRINFEKTFVESVKQAGMNATPETLAKKFRGVIEADKSWYFENNDESDAIILTAAKAAHKAIQKNRTSFEKELKTLP